MQQYENVVESRIREAMDQGRFDNLEGAGQPLPSSELDNLAGENWMGFRVLKNGGLLPERLGLAKEVEQAMQALQRIDDRHARLVERARENGQWDAYLPLIQNEREAFEKQARLLRARQDRFNLESRSIAAERPGIWVEHHLDRLDERLRKARLG